MDHPGPNTATASSSTDFAVRQLVRSIVGHDETGGSAISLARRVLGSHIGGGGEHYPGGMMMGGKHDTTTDLNHLWRRMERKSKDRSSGRQCRTDTERLYRQLDEQVRHHNDNLSNDIPPKLLSVLVKLMGHDKYMPVKATIPRTAAPAPPPNVTAMHNNNNNMPRMTTPANATTIRTSYHPSYNPPPHHQVYNTPAAPSSAASTKAPFVSRVTTVSPAATVSATAATVPQVPIPTPMNHPSSETVVLDEQRLYDERKELIKEEALLLQECLYSLQGIDGERIRYYHRRRRRRRRREDDGDRNDDHANGWEEEEEDTRYEGIRVQSPALTYPSALLHATGRIVPTRLGSGAMDALRICGEAGWLYQRVAQYIQTVQTKEDNAAPLPQHHHSNHNNVKIHSAGVVARAFAGTLAQELRNYHSLLARYESHLRIPNANNSSSSGGCGMDDNSALSLRQLLVELRQPTHRLKILALLTDGVGTLSGGHLLTALYRHGEHGDSRHATLVHSLLYAASRPWFDILYAWTTQGILSDPHGEFFVVKTTTAAAASRREASPAAGVMAPITTTTVNAPNINTTTTTSTTTTDGNLWRNQYTIRKDQIPTGILSKDLVQKALGVGKGINFIRRCLLDSQWTMRLLPPSALSGTTTMTTTPADLASAGMVGGLLGTCLTDPDLFTNASVSLGLGSSGDNHSNIVMGESSNGGAVVPDPLGGMTDEELKHALGYRYQSPLLHDDTGGAMGSLSWSLSSSSSPLAQTLAQAAELVHTHILRALQDDHHLMDHLWALKQFLLLGQGDFFSVLMDGLHTEFGGGGGGSNHNNGGTTTGGGRGGSGVMGIYKHSVLTIVETALRSSNAKYLPQYVLDRLQVELVLEPDEEGIFLYREGGGGGGGGRMDEFKHNGNKNNNAADDDNRTVWDIFMLDYQVPDPLLAIVHPTALDQYKLIFSLLFRLKKVEFLLNYTWRQGAILQHALHTSAQYNGIHLSTSAGYVQASFLLRNISMTRQSMKHWIVNLKSYLMLEVLEGGWKRLVVAMANAKTLDEVIEAHDRYLDGIVRKSLLRTPGTSTTTNTTKTRMTTTQQDPTPKVSGGGGAAAAAVKVSSLSSRPASVQTLLRLVSEFCDLQERLFQQALRAADIAASKRLEAERRLGQGRWSFDIHHDKSEVETFFGLADPAILMDFGRLSTDFEQHAYDLLQVLGDSVNVGTTTTTSNTSSRRKTMGGRTSDHENEDGAKEGDENEDDDDDNDASTCYNKDKAAQRFADFAIDDDLDPQRFLIAQLDHNNYYNSQELS
jgi:hypothetical protein